MHSAKVVPSTNTLNFASNNLDYRKLKASPHWSSMDNNRLYCHFLVSIYKIRKTIANNLTKMDYNLVFFKSI